MYNYFLTTYKTKMRGLLTIIFLPLTKSMRQS